MKAVKTTESKNTFSNILAFSLKIGISGFEITVSFA